ncbi:7-carboxy-7-deazaguanine synthase QueE [Litorivicinus lipolyticus]|uniref:7-carboxy-7-deazaguanine synthase n=1 Tax=Litorivicinus lipolyticus TaxID=418701 RepID=A0A5Q2QG77_9GAMM|nr:7-carboxy-7-deazaguanine synthase QueE [Litorivicinus lipolyticus]QGG80005.1 7-carboxy-7-deazaguanine synthase QueE [Litorivicinus lipolyticus]
MADTLRLTEIFYSLQGETRTMGLPTVFVRLTGCPLRCTWCDSEYSFHGGSIHALDDILAEVAGYRPRYVTVTGGEPLAQPNALPLMRALCDAGYEVNLETSGALDIAEVDPRVSKVMDLKAPGSGEHARNRFDNLMHMGPNDQLKFVLADRVDYEWARMQIDQHGLADKGGELLLSPVHGQLNPRELADWIVADNLPVRMQLQMHKYLWGEEPGH